MEKFFAVILYFFYHFPTQILICELILCFWLKKRKYFWLRFIPCVLFLLWTPYQFGYYNQFTTIGWFTFDFLIYHIMSMLLIWFCFKMSWKKALFFGSAGYAMQHGANGVARAIIEVSGLTLDPNILNLSGEALTSTIWAFAIDFAVFLVFYGIYYLILSKRVKNDEVDIKNIYVIIVSVLTLAVVYVLSMWVFVHNYDVSHKIYASICCFLILLIQFGIFDRSKLTRKNEIMRQLLYSGREQRQMSRENIELINLKCHDLKHQISSLRAMKDDLTREKSIQEIEKAVMIYDSMIKTGNETLDIVLTEKNLFCEKHGIKFSCVAGEW